MDLSDLLEPERIRCQSNVQSKKRTLQTLAELLGESLREKQREALLSADTEQPDGESSAAAEAEERHESIGGKINDALGGRANKAKLGRKPAGKSDTGSDSLSDMEILDALISRERLGSTGLGHGVALPHSRLSAIEEPIAAFVTLDKGVDFESIDGQKVDLVFGLLVPENCNDEHLKILAQLAKRFSDETLRSTLRSFDDPTRLFEYFAARPEAGE